MDDLDKFFFDLGCAVALLLIAVIGSFLPMKLYTGGGRSLIFQIGAMFAGGVMLSAGFCHLLADALEVLEEEVEDFPLGPFLCASGFLVTLLVDQIAEEFAGKDYAAVHGHQHPDTQSRLVEDGSEQGDEKPRVTFYTAALLAMCLCFHSVLEGLALGTEETIKSSIDLAIAIGAHKGMAGYALGVSVLDSNVSKERYWLIMSTFSIASPIGVMVGYAISEFSDSMTSSSLSALAAGTFLYVALMEIIPNELTDKGRKVPKMLALILGFGLMSIVAIWA